MHYGNWIVITSAIAHNAKFPHSKLFSFIEIISTAGATAAGATAGAAGAAKDLNYVEAASDSFWIVGLSSIGEEACRD